MPVLRTTVWITVWSGMKALTAPHCRVILAQNHFAPGLLSPNHVFIRGFLGQGSSDQTAFSGNNFDFGTSIEDKRTVSEYYNQMNVLLSRYTLQDCEGKLKGMPGSITIRETESITNKSTAREYNNNQRTNGPVNAHLISGPSKSTKQTKPGNEYEKDLINNS